MLHRSSVTNNSNIFHSARLNYLLKFLEVPCTKVALYPETARFIFLNSKHHSSRYSQKRIFFFRWESSADWVFILSQYLLNTFKNRDAKIYDPHTFKAHLIIMTPKLCSNTLKLFQEQGASFCLSKPFCLDLFKLGSYSLTSWCSRWTEKLKATPLSAMNPKKK